MKRTVYIAAAALMAAMMICGCAGKKSDDVKADAGFEVHGMQEITSNIRLLSSEDFSVYLKYPGIVYARSESTAYAVISDVVRNINVKVGDQVEQDQVILTLSMDKQSYRQASLAWENAQASYERNRLLYENGDISRQNFDTITMQYELARANYNTARDMVNIKAPISGTITRLNVHPTANVSPGMALFTVSGWNGYEARFFVGALEIDLIHSGARVFIDHGGNNPGQGIEGRVTQVSLVMDSAKQAFPVTAAFEMTGQKLASGMGVDLAVETYRNEKAIVVSRSELRRTDKGFEAYIAQGNKPEPVSVELGHVQGSKYEVIKGLESGDLLISNGVGGLPASASGDGVLAMAKMK